MKSGDHLPAAGQITRVEVSYLVERIQQGKQVDAADALFAVGDTIDRIT